MKVLIVNHSDSRGGASVVSLRLLEALRNMGVDASMLVLHKQTINPDVARFKIPIGLRIPFYKEHLRIFAANGFNRDTLFKISIASDGYHIWKHPLVKDADVIILNWVNQGMLSLAGIERLAKMGKRIVWTMHDMWNATAICHHAGLCRNFIAPQGCANCPLLGSKASHRDLASKTWRQKKEFYSRVPITFVAVSSWLLEKCRESTLLKDARIHMIPNAFPIDEFTTNPSVARTALGLPSSGKIILMGAARLDDPIKGLPYAVETLNAMKQCNATAVFFGEIRDSQALEKLRFPHICLGTVSDKDKLRQIYAHADVLISTSLFETLPGTLVEAQASGTVPIAFNSGGQSDIIENGSTGYLVEPYDTQAFARAITKALEEPFNEADLRNAAARFAAPNIAKSYLSII